MNVLTKIRELFVPTPPPEPKCVGEILVQLDSAVAELYELAEREGERASRLELEILRAQEDKAGAEAEVAHAHRVAAKIEELLA